MPTNNRMDGGDMDKVAAAAGSPQELDAIVSGRVTQTVEAVDTHFDSILIRQLRTAVGAILRGCPAVVRELPELQALLDVNEERQVSALREMHDADRTELADVLLLFAAHHFGPTAFPPAFRRARIKAGHPD